MPSHSGFLGKSGSIPYLLSRTTPLPVSDFPYQKSNFDRFDERRGEKKAIRRHASSGYYFTYLFATVCLTGIELTLHLPNYPLRPQPLHLLHSKPAQLPQYVPRMLADPWRIRRRSPPVVALNVEGAADELHRLPLRVADGDATASLGGLRVGEQVGVVPQGRVGDADRLEQCDPLARRHEQGRQRIRDRLSV